MRLGTKFSFGLAALSFIAVFDRTLRVHLMFSGCYSGVFPATYL